jgi:hypothetical protein
MKTGKFIVLLKSSELLRNNEYLEIEILEITNKFIHLRYVNVNYNKWMTFDDFNKEYEIKEELKNELDIIIENIKNIFK